MASNAAKKLQYDGKPVQVESAIRDKNGAQIDTSYLKLDGTNTMTGALQLKATGNNETNIGSNGIRWGTTSLPQDTAPQYVCTIDAFASGGRQKWASIADLKTALAVPVETTVSGWGFTKNTGTITGVSVNGTSVATSGTAALTDIAKTNVNNKFTTSQTIHSELNVYGTNDVKNAYINVWGDGSGESGVSLGSKMNAATASSYDNFVQIFYDNEVASRYLTLYADQITWNNEGDEYAYYFPDKTGTLALTSDFSASSSAVSGATEAKSLTINGTSWNLPSGGGGGSGITEISTQYIRIWDLTPGVYKLTYNGTKYLYYYGATNTSNTHTVTGGAGAVILTINMYSTTYKHWYYINGTSSYATLYYGYTYSSGGSTTSKAINNLLTSHKAHYQHNIRVTVNWKSEASIAIGLYFTIISSSSTAYTASSLCTYIYNSFTTSPFYLVPFSAPTPIFNGAGDGWIGYVNEITRNSSSSFKLVFSDYDGPSQGDAITVYAASSSASSGDAYIDSIYDKVISF